MTDQRMLRLATELEKLMKPHSLVCANLIGLLIRQELDREYRRGYTEGVASSKVEKTS